jgi:hypothetical protein
MFLGSATIPQRLLPGVDVLIQRSLLVFLEWTDETGVLQCGPAFSVP